MGLSMGVGRRVLYPPHPFALCVVYRVFLNLIAQGVTIMAKSTGNTASEKAVSMEKKAMRVRFGRWLYFVRVLGSFMIHMGNYKLPSDDIVDA
jgi:hypothetical protein